MAYVELHDEALALLRLSCTSTSLFNLVETELENSC